MLTFRNRNHCCMVVYSCFFLISCSHFPCNYNRRPWPKTFIKKKYQLFYSCQDSLPSFFNLIFFFFFIILFTTSLTFFLYFFFYLPISLLFISFWDGYLSRLHLNNSVQYFKTIHNTTKIRYARFYK